MICLTAFYYMTPQQKFVNQRCISPLVGSFVAFDITKVNPFNQMLDADPKLAGLLYTASSSRCSSKKGNKSVGVDPKKLGLTLANIQMHDQQAKRAGDKFIPKVNRLIDMVQGRGVPQPKSQKATTVFQDDFPIFDALYEMEQECASSRGSRNRGEKIEDLEDEDTALYSQNERDKHKNPNLTQADFKDSFMTSILDFESIERDFGKVHLLIDKLFQNEDDLVPQNSYLF